MFVCNFVVFYTINTSFCICLFIYLYVWEQNWVSHILCLCERASRSVHSTSLAHIVNNPCTRSNAMPIHSQQCVVRKPHKCSLLYDFFFTLPIYCLLYYRLSRRAVRATAFPSHPKSPKKSPRVSTPVLYIISGVDRPSELDDSCIKNGDNE